MKKLQEFVLEGRRPKNAQVDPDKVKPGVDAEDNGTGGLWAIDEPVDNEAVPDLTEDDMNENMMALLDKFEAQEDFFIVGEAGWGKTSIIKNMAKRFKRNVVTVYLDKAAKEDLGGIPVPVKGKTGAVQELALPGWAKIMEDNPNQKFLLFFDEMNQAQPDIMNALMPIVLEHEICGRKFKNFFVGAAGNYEHENDALFELQGPLKSRFKPLITWECGTPEAWKAAFKYMKKKWGKDESTQNLIDVLEQNQSLFVNPREVEMKIIQHACNVKKGENKKFYSSSFFLKRLKGLVKDDLTRTETTQLQEVADALYEFISDTGAAKKQRRGGGKDISMVPENIIEAIKHGMKHGFIPDGDTKYGISRENILTIQDMDEDSINAEMLERIINKFEADGIKFKFETDDEWKKAGYKDPNED